MDQEQAATTSSSPRDVPSGPPAAPRNARGASWVNIALGLAIAVAIGGVSFAAGRFTAPTVAGPAGFGGNGQGAFPRGSFDPNGANGGGGFGGGGFGGRGGAGFGGGGVSLEGTVESVSPTTLTLKLTSGQTIQVTLDGATTYHSQASASADAVASGGTVIVRVDLGGQGGGAAAGASARDVTIVP
jgi:hypothetical protein